MTDDGTRKVILERVDEILDNETVQEIIIALRQDGRTIEEIRRAVIMMAIGSLIGD